MQNFLLDHTSGVDLNGEVPPTEPVTSFPATRWMFPLEEDHLILIRSVPTLFEVQQRLEEYQLFLLNMICVFQSV